MTVYAQPGAEGSKVTFKDRYENWIGGEWVAPPVKGAYFENITPPSRAKPSAKLPVVPRRTSSWRWTPPIRLHPPGGARRRPPNAPPS